MHEVLYMPTMAGESFIPANGTEGMIFYAGWCESCWRDREYQETQENGCPILAGTMLHDVDSEEYPKEWVHADNGRAVCLGYAVQKPEFDDPDQMVFELEAT